MLALPPVLALAAWKLCRDLAGADAVEHRKEEIRGGGAGHTGETAESGEGEAEEPGAGRREPSLVERVLRTVVVGAAVGAAVRDRARSRHRRG